MSENSNRHNRLIDCNPVSIYDSMHEIPVVEFPSRGCPGNLITGPIEIDERICECLLPFLAGKKV